MNIPYIAQLRVDDYGLPFSTLKYSVKLPATTDKTLTVPGSSPKFKAVMRAESGGEVWVALNATAAVPVDADIDPVSSELIPINGTLCREVSAGDVLHFITRGTDIDVGIVFYSLNTISGI